MVVKRGERNLAEQCSFPLSPPPLSHNRILTRFRLTAWLWISNKQVCSSLSSSSLLLSLIPHVSLHRSFSSATRDPYNLRPRDSFQTTPKFKAKPFLPITSPQLSSLTISFESPSKPFQTGDHIHNYSLS